MKHRRLVKLLALLVVLTLVAAACGRGSSGKSSSETTSKGGETKKELKPTAGFDGTTIKVGVITPQTGAAAVIGNPLTAGNQVWVDKVNAAGGIAGKYKLELVVKDNKYDPPTTVQQYNATKNDVAMFMQILGTPPTQAVLPQLKTDNILASPASLDAPWVAEKNLLPILAPYQVQAINGLTEYMDNMGGKGKKVCTITSDDPYGAAGLEGAEFAAKQGKWDIGVKAKFKVGDASFDAQIGQLQSGGCEVVWVTSLPTEFSKILGTAAGKNFAPEWLAQSPTWVAVFVSTPLAPYLKDHVLLVSEGVEWGDKSNKGMQDMLADIAKYKPDQKPDIYFAFGYMQAMAVTEVLEKAVKDGDLSRQGIIDAMGGIGKLTFDDLVGDYTYGLPADRVPPRESTLFKITPDTLDTNGALTAVKTNFETDAAKAYKFPNE